MPIYKILARQEWEAAQRAGTFTGSAVDQRDGYIHFSTAAQVAETARLHFRGQANLVVLEVDPSTLEDSLKWEPSRGGALFPHLYRPLPVAAVRAVHGAPLGGDGVPVITFAYGTIKGVEPGSRFREWPDAPEMIVVPPGRFIMGSPATEEGRFENEGPQHVVTISRRFAMGVYHVTRGEYAAFVAATGRPEGDGCHYWDGTQAPKDPARNWRNPGFAQTDRHPVVAMSWEDAQAYVAWLNARAGVIGAAGPYRLPSEAEWEYAARAGTTTRYFWGDEESALCRHANGRDQALYRAKGWSDCAACDDGYVYTSPVGSFPPNAFGLYDMAGNAWQWTADCYHADYAGAPGDGSAWLAGDDGSRVFRGGAWSFGPRGLRSAYRDKTTTDFRYNGFGFRVVRDLE